MTTPHTTDEKKRPKRSRLPRTSASMVMSAGAPLFVEPAPFAREAVQK